MEFSAFFRTATGHDPYDYQRRLAEEPWPDLIDIPTGLGKTAAVVLAWLYKREHQPEETPRRLIWCLPMRTLVEQTARNAKQWVDALGEHLHQPPLVQTMMGGFQEVDWAENPEQPALIVGTQDMLLSRALMRGYGMSRYQWPIHYACLNNDALWVFDETQLMGVAVPTSAQLQAFRKRFGTARETTTVWMSATLAEDEMVTVDHPKPEGGYARVTLDETDRQITAVQKRVASHKKLHHCEVDIARKTSDADLSKLAQVIVDEHVQGTLTLVVLNQVARAQELYRQLKSRAEDTKVGLLHSRYRPADRAEKMKILEATGDRILVATQVVEAGVDIDATTLFTELCPFPSFVQRVGRCNRRGTRDDARVFWVDLRVNDDKDALGLPYTYEELQTAKRLLSQLEGASPNELSQLDYQPPPTNHHIIRSRDFLELFDTSPDLAGNDIDVSRFIRDSDDNDVQVFWRQWEKNPPPTLVAPHRDELCSLSIPNAESFRGKKGVFWEWDPLNETWRAAGKLQAGQTYLLSCDVGGYDLEMGFVGKTSKAPVPEVLPPSSPVAEAMGYDGSSYVYAWVPLVKHLEDVRIYAEALAETFELDTYWRDCVVTAAHWHDIGKAHPVFQRMLLTPEPGSDDPPQDPNTLWGKSDHRRGRAERKHFRHELASALVWIESQPRSPRVDAIAYLIAAHHGKIRGSLRSLPDEMRPKMSGARFARGVWQGDTLPAVGTVSPAAQIELECLEMGSNSWIERVLSLVTEFGPIRLAWYESLVRIADHRGS